MICILSLSWSVVLLIQKYNPNRLIFRGKYEHTYAKQAPYPQTLSIPNSDIFVPIISVEETKTKLPTTEQGVAYMTSSPLPGQKGNSVLYGHNWSSILGYLNKTRIGDEVIITYQDGEVALFKVVFIGIVTPDQTHIIEPSSDTRVTIYTCSGIFDEKRLVVTAIAKDSLRFSANAKQ